MESNENNVPLFINPDNNEIINGCIDDNNDNSHYRNHVNNILQKDLIIPLEKKK